MVDLAGQVNAGNTAYLSVSFYDEDGNLSAPTSAVWEVFDYGTGTTVLAETEIGSIASTVTLTLTPAINTILDSNNDQETRQVVVTATSGASVITIGYAYYDLLSE